MNQCPLLLKYKFRDCYYGDETEIIGNVDIWHSPWKEYETPKHEIWLLQWPDSREFLTANKNIQSFHRYEIHVAGKKDPVAAYFNVESESYFETEPVRTYRLPENHSIGYGERFILNENIEQLLREYERNRDGIWETRIFVGR